MIHIKIAVILIGTVVGGIIFAVAGMAVFIRLRRWILRILGRGEVRDDPNPTIILTNLDQLTERADANADSIRRFLVGLNTGGIAVTFAVANTLAERDISLSWALYLVAVFTGGLIITGVSLFLAKHKVLKRRVAARDGRPQPDFERYRWRNYTYDLAAFAVFLFGITYGLSNLSAVQAQQGEVTTTNPPSARDSQIQFKPIPRRNRVTPGSSWRWWWQAEPC